MWNLPPPPGFQGLQPDKPITVYQRHLPHWRQDGATYFVTFRLADSLPQSKLNELAALKADWQRRLRETAQDSATAQDGGTALVSRHPPTAHESRPTILSRPTLKNPHTSQRPLTIQSPLTAFDPVLEELARLVQERIERWLDQGMGSCPLKQAALAAFLASAMHHFDGDRYELGCYVIMPNHAHVIVRPLIPEVYALETILGSWKKYSARRINRARQQTGALWLDESYDRILRDEEHLWHAIQYIGANPDKAGLPRETCPLWIRPQWVELGWRFDGTRLAGKS